MNREEPFGYINSFQHLRPFPLTSPWIRGQVRVFVNNRYDDSRLFEKFLVTHLCSSKVIITGWLIKNLDNVRDGSLKKECDDSTT